MIKGHIEMGLYTFEIAPGAASADELTARRMSWSPDAGLGIPSKWRPTVEDARTGKMMRCVQGSTCDFKDPVASTAYRCI
jgi:hypothetical protein